MSSLLNERMKEGKLMGLETLTIAPGLALLLVGLFVGLLMSATKNKR